MLKLLTPATLRSRLGSLDRVCVVLLMLAFAVSGRSQTVSQYSFAQSSGTYTAISGGTALSTSSYDDAVYTVTIPSFTFAGAAYTTMYVSSNGFVTFGSAPATNAYDPISSNAGYSGAVSAFGCDIDNASSGSPLIRWQQVGNEVVVQWAEARRQSVSSERISFQIRLNTSTGVINVVYGGTIAPQSSTSNYPVVGLRGVNNTFATNVNNRRVDTSSGSGSTWANTAAGTTNADECRFNNQQAGRAPAVGQTYTWTPPCLPPTVSNAGSDQTICATTSSVTLGANTATVGTGAWSVVSGPSTLNSQFSSTTSVSPTFTPAGGAGTYTLRWTISNNPCTASTDDVVITVKALPTVAAAGNDQTICSTAGSATMAANAAVNGTGAWSQISGPATATITTAASATTTITAMTTTGTYVFRWTISNSPCTATTDDVAITSIPGTTVSAAGADQSSCVSSPAVTLAANIPTTGTGAWSVVSGPSTASAQFASTSVNNTVFTATGGAGTYTLRWTIGGNSPCGNSTDDVVITVKASPTVAAAGTDQTICSTAGSATMAGNTAASGTGAWSQISGPSTATITTASSPTTTITAMTSVGTYVFRWTISNAPCTATTDDVSIFTTPGTTTSNAGPDQSFCLSSISTTLAANSPVNGTGAWSILAGSPNTSTAQLSSAASPTATFTPTASGTYTLRWTINNSPCAASTNDVVITVVPFASAVSQTFNADAGFVVPAGVTQITVQAWGGGATGGGSTDAGSFQIRGGAGGGGGAYVTKTLTVTPGSTLNVVVGAQVNGTTGANGTNGNPSTITGLESQIFAAGGTGGAGNLTGNSPAGGAGGTLAASQGDSETAGGNGGNGATGFITGGNSGAGGAGANGGGAGGAAITNTGTTANGNNGTAPGGGGSGGHTSQNGGARAGGSGAAGRVIITYTPVPSLSASASTICQGGSSTLTASGGNTYLWSPGGATTASIVVNPATTTTYSVTITNTCPEQLTQGITVVQPANAGTNGTLTICSNVAAASLFAQLGGTPQGGGSWTGPSTVVSGLYDPATMNPGLYTYTVNGTSPCPNPSATVNVTENPATTWYADIDGDGFGDAGSSTTSCAQPLGYVSNSSDLCPTDGNKQAPGQCGCGNPDTDTDSDGTADCNDACPNDANKIAPGICGCGVSDVDTDLDGTADCNDGCPLDVNKTAPGICGCGVSDADTDLDGTADCNDECPLDPNKVVPGQCGCGVVDTDTDLDGTADCNDGCPDDPYKLAPGICGCSTPDDDTDGDGLADCVDPCPESAENSDTDGDGTYDCVDNCPLDPNKVNPGACGCGNADTDTDGDTYADCLDACPTDPNKIAPGTCGCGVADADTDGDGTFNCNDGCPTDANKVAPGTCGCGVADTDTDSDGVADCNDNCPSSPGQIGSTCDDNNANTINDVLTGACVCAGTPVANLAQLEMRTDNDGASTSWEIVPLAGGAPVCSGANLASNSTLLMSCSLPDGCYKLSVYDSGMDGMCCMNGVGGYVLRTNGGQRIIDAAGSGIFSGTAEVTLGFCVPIGGDHLTPSRCDREDYLPSDFIQATPNTAVQAQFGVGTQSDDGYQFWIFNPNGGYSRRVLVTHATNNYLYPAGPDRCTYLRLNSLTSSPIPHNMLVNVRVRSLVNGVYSEFGSACRLKIDLTNQCPTTQLIDDPSNSHNSCGLVNVPLNGSRTLYAVPVSGATNYQFEFSKQGYLRKISSTGSNLLLTQWLTMPLQYGNSYHVRVRVSFDNGANYCPFSTSCTVSTAGSPPGNQNAMEAGSEDMDLSVWPNPNHGEVITLKLAGFGDDSQQDVVLSVVDMFGKQVVAQRMSVEGDVLNTTIDMSGMAAGMYLVNVTAADRTWTERLIVQ